MTSAGTKFVFQCSDTAKDMLLHEGIDYKYGARHLKRSIERFLVYPLSNLVATGQIALGDLVHVDLNLGTRKLLFSKQSGGALIPEITAAIPDEEHVAARSGSVGLPIPQVKEGKAARKGQGRGEKSEG
jgi:C-terminal, D2-small domain, of ClpB protein